MILTASRLEIQESLPGTQAVKPHSLDVTPYCQEAVSNNGRIDCFWPALPLEIWNKMLFKINSVVLGSHQGSKKLQSSKEERRKGKTMEILGSGIVGGMCRFKDVKTGNFCISLQQTLDKMRNHTHLHCDTKR